MFSVLSLKEALLQGNAIYILDGGVSTHLQCNLCHGIPFRYHELWSSSLLVVVEDPDHQEPEHPTNNDNDNNNNDNNNNNDSKQFACHGHELIYQGHLDWLHAGANIVSTVTYQCHYEPRLWPSPASTATAAAAAVWFSSSAMDAMMETAIDLARRAITTVTADHSLTNRTSEKQEAEEQQEIIAVGNRRRRPHWIAVSLGCFGAALANGAEYTGSYGHVDTDDHQNTLSLSPIETKAIDDELMIFHQKRINKAIELKNVDAIALETIPSFLECQALVKLLTSPIIQKQSSSLPAFWISLACRNGSDLNDGTPVVDALRVLREIPSNVLQGIGFNCCDSQYLGSLCHLLVQEYLEDAASVVASADSLRGGRPSGVRAILLYPNSGEVYDADAKDWVPHTGCRDGSALADRLVQIVHDIRDQWRQGMADMETKQTSSDQGQQLPVPTIVLGGCCRTEPDTIASLRNWVDAQPQWH